MRPRLPTKLRLLAALALVALALACAVVRLGTRESLAARAKRIRSGMTPAEVERVLGRPPDWAGEIGPQPARTPADEFWHPAATGRRVRHEMRTTESAVVYVWYIDGVVESTDHYERASRWDRLLNRLP